MCSDLAAKAARGVAESDSRGMDCGWSRDGGGEQGPADAAEEAMDGDDPKPSLIALIVEAASSRGNTVD